MAIGNKLASQVTELNSMKNPAGETVRRISASNEMLLYVALMLVVAAVFAVISSRFPEAPVTEEK